MHSFCLNFIADFSFICTPLLLLSGPIETALLLQTLSIPENEMNRMHYIPLGRDVEQGDLPTFFFRNDIKSGKGESFSCEITHHPGLSCICSVRKNSTLLQETNGGKKNTEDIWLSMCSLSPAFLCPTCHD